jgi:catechol 2,3-dioxygenase-like lactoylglutathione lyase family enzyme
VTSTDFEPDLVPELLVSDLDSSIEFWCGLCGFEIAYERPEERFAYITRGNAHLMLEERGAGRNWLPGEMLHPFGRGINFQISVDDLDPVASALRDDGVELFMDAETKWYRVSDADEVGVRQFLVTDPDGYLIRFQMSLGRRAAND